MKATDIQTIEKERKHEIKKQTKSWILDTNFSLVKLSLVERLDTIISNYATKREDRKKIAYVSHGIQNKLD